MPENQRLKHAMQELYLWGYIPSPFLFWDSVSLSWPGWPLVCNPASSDSWVAGIRGMCHSVQLLIFYWQHLSEMRNQPEMKLSKWGRDSLIPFMRRKEFFQICLETLNKHHWTDSFTAEQPVHNCKSPRERTVHSILIKSILLQKYFSQQWKRNIGYRCLDLVSDS